MDTIPLNTAAKTSEFSSSSRLLILQSLVPIATNLVSSQIEAFTGRLTEALFKLSDQTIRPEEVATSFAAYQQLKRNGTTFYRLVAGQVNAALAKEVSVVNTRKRARTDEGKQDFSLVSFEEMESKVLSRNLSQSLEVTNAEQLVSLNVRIGHVLRRTPISVSQNPFRPELFVKAVHQAWMELEPNPDTHHLILRLLRPELFLQLGTIYRELNLALVERGILPDLNDGYRNKQKKNMMSGSDDISNRDPYLENKLRNIFSGNAPTGSFGNTVTGGGGGGGTTMDGGGMPFNGGQDAGGGGFGGGHSGGNGGGGGGSGSSGSSGNAPDMVTIDRQFFDYLTSVQRDFSANPMPTDTAHLRQLSQQPNAGGLTHIDQSTIELLARIFDYVFNDNSIPADIKNLISQLQIPTLKVALLDKCS
ncbi:MAG: DUF1631 family protein [Burkholderiales bacterium]|nr:DUF1631 family protein [Burkholderiales bacterium]